MDSEFTVAASLPNGAHGHADQVNVGNSEAESFLLR